MESRPKDPKTARNKNVLIVGGSGSGKTRFWLKPNLMQCHSSYVITDPKGTVLLECGKLLQKKGYRIKVLNTINFTKSQHYNPFAYIHSEKDILKLVTTLIANTKGEGKSNDDFWQKAETLLYTALIGYIHYVAPPEEQNFAMLIDLINSMETHEDDETFQNPVDEMFERLAKDDPNHFAVRQYRKYKLAAGNTLHKIFLSVFTLACQRLASPQVWNQFADVRSFLENYLTLLNDSITRYRSRSASIDNSIEQMTHELYVLANERLSIEGPSSEKIGNSVYEKGAYEKIINAWSGWLKTLCKIAYLLSDGDDARAVSFMIIPTIYGQTKSLNHIEFNHLSSIPRSIVVYLSVREMFRVSELLLTLAHEVGHYCAITQRKQRTSFFIYCVCTSTIAGTLYIWHPDGRTKRTKQDADMDKVDLYWMMQLHMKVSDIMMTALQNTEYLDECASQVRAIIQEVFQEEPSSRKDVNDIKNCFLKYCPALCEDQQAFESYGFRLVHLLDRRIKDYISIFRETNADLFMLYVLQPELLDYLKIIVDQATDHLGLYHLLECVEIALDNDAEISNEQSAWYTLYMRLSCCIISYYVHNDCEKKREADLLAVLRTVKEQADAQNDKAICKLLACLIRQIEKLREVESSDSFCLDILCRYGKRVLTQFGQKNDNEVERARDLYTRTRCLSRESTIASLYHFLDNMEDWS